MYHALEADMINLYYPKSLVLRLKATFPDDLILHALLDSGSKEVGAHLESLEVPPAIKTAFHAEWSQWVELKEANT
jgi:hypothetical protein